VEVHGQHHLRLQTRQQPDTARRPDPVDPLQGRSVQVPQNQAHEEIFAPGQQRGLSRPERHHCGQNQPCDTVAGYVGSAAAEVPAAGEEGEV